MILSIHRRQLSCLNDIEPAQKIGTTRTVSGALIESLLRLADATENNTFLRMRVRNKQDNPCKMSNMVPVKAPVYCSSTQSNIIEKPI